MGLRPARCMRKITRGFTRVAPKVQRKNFLGGVPGVRTREFTIGDQTKEYNTQFDVVAKASLQIRDNALEAMRQKLVKKLTDVCGKDNYVLKLRLFPHQIVREHKAATGAGADRVSKGMKHAYGKNTMRGLQIRNNQLFLSVVADKSFASKVRIILDCIRHKVFLPYEIIEKEHKDKKLSGRKRWTRESKKQRIARENEEKEATAKAAAKAAAEVKTAVETKPGEGQSKTADKKEAKGKK